MAKSVAKARKTPSRSSGATLKIGLAALGLAAFAALPLVLILVPGMMPTLATLLVGRQRPRHLTYTVGVMNFAGVLPFLLALAKAKLTLTAAAATLCDAESWLVMYGAAAAGWMIYSVTPPLARTCIELQVAHRRRALESLGKAICKEWGAEVAGEELGSKR